MIKGIGIDSVEIERVERIYRDYGDRFLRRVFSPAERAYALKFKDPVPRLAARFAAKEACMKALGTGWNNGVRWQDIVVENDRSGKPALRLSGRARECFELIPATHAHVSLTHSRDRAIAVVIFE